MVPAHLIPNLARDAEAAITTALTTRPPGFISTPRSEVGYVAAVVKAAVPDIAARWKPRLNPHGITLRITGVFCHASPMVVFPQVGRTFATPTDMRELADLLVVHDDYSSGTATDRRAVLIQAKVSASGVVTSPDVPQLRLYRDWPEFESRYPAFPLGVRDFGTATFAGATQDCGRYGIIDTSSSSGPDWRVVPPAFPPLSASGQPTLGTFIAEMLGRTGTGRGREATVGGGTDDWSKTVEDLLTITAGRYFTHRASFRKKKLRGETAFAVAFPGVEFGGGGPPDEGSAVFEGDGLSTIYIETESGGASDLR